MNTTTGTEEDAGGEVGRRVRAVLEAKASEWGVKRFLFVAEGGSRASGLGHPTSDLDVRFIYARPLREYISVSPTRRPSLHIRATTTLELPGSDEGQKGESVELDLFGWDVDKALALIRDSNPNLLEWMRSPIVYYADEAFHCQVTALIQAHFQPKALAHHYINMAKKHDRLFFEGKGQDDPVSLKKYFYVFGPLMSVEWMRERSAAEQRTLPPINFAALSSGITIDEKVRLVLENLVRSKKESRLGQAQRIPELDSWIAQLFVNAARYAESFPGKIEAPVSEFDELLYAVLTQ